MLASFSQSRETPMHVLYVHTHSGGGGGGGGSSSSTSTVDHGLMRRLAPDPVNLDVLVWVDRLLPRELAKVSVLDSTVQVRSRSVKFHGLAAWHPACG
jgi:hypothetical protein